jgi:DNA-binding MarR family transcriptional regulator
MYLYDSSAYERLRSIGYLLNRLRSEILAAVDGELAADERLAYLRLSSAQSVIMTSLALGGGTSAADLCKAMSYDTGAMTRIIDRLESKGLIRRNRCCQDRRRVTLELTEEGVAVLPRIREISTRVMSRFLRSFTDSEARQLEMFLSRVLASA